MIDKHAGKVACSAMSFGGFRGIGEKSHPLPWDALDYDTCAGGYRVNISRGILEAAPSYSRVDIDASDYSTSGPVIDC